MKFRMSNVTRLCATVVATSILLLPALSRAGTLDSLGALNQDQFSDLTENLGAGTHYKGVSPGEGQGLLGFDVGVVLSSTEIDENLFDAGSNGSFDSGQINLARVQVLKGLPFGLDIGASLTKSIDTDISIVGAEVRYSLIDGGILTPSLAVRASYSQMEGVDDLDLSNGALELTVSKGFVMLTPFAGVGIVQTRAKLDGEGGLDSETVEQNKLYVGLTINLGVAITVEADQTGDYQSYSAKAGLRF
ncbi:hypothetical protein [Granulosicoccus antarcticus]|uniref:Outer membrane protein beta-barrel domain-containing protein n=1 Tax=Granulosicoccus antarcticus IMCC3135 TaxID=1192854 RepID=A0A2Z2NU78_9GAMM|nr:hypothetical protein [Granulosicoccus antarcticus]ASJ75056.1 hypothetical protein IMCC3135_24960 [Granulosicoccus antarcticus IMCC3135]